jgi:hypothetical protein
VCTAGVYCGCEFGRRELARDDSDSDIACEESTDWSSDCRSVACCNMIVNADCLAAECWSVESLAIFNAIPSACIADPASEVSLASPAPLTGLREKLSAGNSLGSNSDSWPSSLPLTEPLPWPLALVRPGPSSRRFEGRRVRGGGMVTRPAPVLPVVLVLALVLVLVLVPFVSNVCSGDVFKAEAYALSNADAWPCVWSVFVFAFGGPLGAVMEATLIKCPVSASRCSRCSARRMEAVVWLEIEWCGVFLRDGC